MQTKREKPSIFVEEKQKICPESTPEGVLFYLSLGVDFWFLLCYNSKAKFYKRCDFYDKN